MSGTNSNTEVKQVETTLAAILGAPTGENIISQTPKNNLFSNKKPDPLSAADLEKAAQEKLEAAAKAKEATDKKKLEDEATELERKKKEAENTEKGKTGTAKSLIAELNEEEQAAAEEAKKSSGGRPEFQRAGLIQVVNDLLKEEKFIPLDDPKPMEEWTKDDFKEFIELNLSHREDQIKEEIPVAFYDALPPEFQTAFTYLENLRGAKGGYTPQDVQHILKVVTQAVEITNLDPSTEEGQEQIVRTYLQSTQWGTPEEIDEEVKSLQDKEELSKKANQFKPKLDALQQKQIEQNIKTQEKARKNAEKAASNFMDSVYKALEPGILGGIKLDKKTQGSLYNALVQPAYQSFTGGQTNELGHLLESKQFGQEKDLESVMLATWLLRDKEGFLAKVREQGGSQKAAEVAKKLKTEQANHGTASGEEDELAGANRGVKKLVRKTNNIFK